MIFRHGGRRKARQPSLLLFVILVLTVIAQLSAAQRLTEAPDPDTTDAATTRQQRPATTAEPTTTEETSARTTAETSAETTQASSTETTAETTAESTTETTAETTAETTGFTITTESQTSTATSTTESSSSSSTSSSNLVPVVTPPPIGDAPYMQRSDTPEGTIFIAVGAALGFLGFAVLAWRGLVAWSVNRSVRRAALMHSSESKGLLRSKKKKSAHTHGAMPPVSLEKLSGHKRGSYANSRSSKIPSSGSGLFFSPTAGQHSGGNRGSSYLPAGYYAAGGAAAGGSHSSVHFSSSDLPGLGPQAQGYVRTRSGPSPPGTPTYEPPQPNMSRHSYVGGSTSSVNLSSPPPQGRTPSAYLEDLFENHAPQQNQQNRNNRR